MTEEILSPSFQRQGTSSPRESSLREKGQCVGALASLISSSPSADPLHLRLPSEQHWCFQVLLNTLCQSCLTLVKDAVLVVTN